MSAPRPLMAWTRCAPAPASRIAGSGLQNQEHSMPHNTSHLEAVATIGIDIGKNTFHLIGLDRNGAIVLRQKLSRRQIELGSRIRRPASSAWRHALGRIT